MNSKKNCQKLADLTRDWTQVACTTVRYVNHYTKVSSVLVSNCKWILIHAWAKLSSSSNSSNSTKIPSFWKKIDCWSRTHSQNLVTKVYWWNLAWVENRMPPPPPVKEITSFPFQHRARYHEIVVLTFTLVCTLVLLWNLRRLISS